MSDKSIIAARKISGLYSSFIDEIVDNKIVYHNNYDINNIIHLKTIKILSTYNIDDCIRIINRYGDFYDALIKYSENNTENINIYKYDKLLFHRKLAYYYIKYTIQIKVEMKSKEKIKFIDTSNYECSICFEPITNNNKITTLCKHSFHLNCFHSWSHKNSCPNCRTKLYD